MMSNGAEMGHPQQQMNMMQPQYQQMPVDNRPVSKKKYDVTYFCFKIMKLLKCLYLQKDSNKTVPIDSRSVFNY